MAVGICNFLLIVVSNGIKEEITPLLNSMANVDEVSDYLVDRHYLL